MNLREQRSDVQPLVAAYLAPGPQAYTAEGLRPDPGALAAWMEKMLQTSGGLKLTRSADPYDRVVRYLEAEGVDVPRQLQRVCRAHEAEQHRTRAAADRARDLALNLKSAERALLHEARGVNSNAVGFTAATLREAQERVTRLTAALEAACVDDPQLARSVRRSVA
jgi:hypothetical protein